MSGIICVERVGAFLKIIWKDDVLFNTHRYLIHIPSIVSMEYSQNMNIMHRMSYSLLLRTNINVYTFTSTTAKSSLELYTKIEEELK